MHFRIAGQHDNRQICFRGILVYMNPRDELNAVRQRHVPNGNDQFRIMLHDLGEDITTFDRYYLIGASVADEKQTDQAADLPTIITYKNSNITEIVTRTDTKIFPLNFHENDPIFTSVSANFLILPCSTGS